ncbi:ABC transporter permease subunit [Marinomonas ostreistagni]|uniref:ABC transporter permease subunit n=1 Tax=Marinomonas ostreistagni TaxID=359209 RepID=UPI00194E62E7|nr:ABC transporter permease subunit [Marinomonas ostreistagni]MBM6550061.1 ABC transporter permease subunit [Marinomonas ostreistagni]
MSVYHALVLQPEILVADEPTSSLDPVSRQRLIDLLNTIKQRRNMKLLLVTHDLTAAEALCDVMLVLNHIIAGLLIAGIFGMTPYSALIAIVLVSWAPLAAHCSSLIMEAKAKPYTHLAPVWGASQVRILRFYLLPYILPPLLRHALLRLPVTILSLTALSFIGLGAKSPTPEWGLMIAENLPYIERAPQGVMGPIVGLVLFGVAINLLFDD